MKKPSILIVIALVSLCVGAATERATSLPRNDKDYHRQLTLSTDEARAAMSECAVCAAPAAEKRSFASFFGTITRFLSRIRHGLFELIWGENDAYNVERDVLPVFVNGSVQLASLSERLQQQADALEDRDFALPKVVSWVYRSSAASVQALASYIDTITIEMSKSGSTMDSDTLECFVSRIVDFMFQNTFPNIVTVTESVVAARNAWLPDDSKAASPTTSREGSLQNLIPTGDDLICLADDAALEASVVVTSDAANSHLFFFPQRRIQICTPETNCTLILLLLLLLLLFMPLFSVLSLVVRIIMTIVNLPATVIQFILFLLGITVSIVTGVADATNPNLEGADALALLVDVLQASPLTSGFKAPPEPSSPEFQCKVEALMCRLDTLQQAFPPL
jgi:hypothetical protein